MALFFPSAGSGRRLPLVTGSSDCFRNLYGKIECRIYGGLLASNAFLWILFWTGRGKRLLKEKGIYAFALISLSISAVLAVVDVTGAGILQRYMVDMIWGIWLTAVLVCLALAEQAGREGTLRGLLLCLTAVCFLQLFYGFGVVMGNGDLSVNVRTSNPGLYYYLQELFRF